MLHKCNLPSGQSRHFPLGQQALDRHPEHLRFFNILLYHVHLLQPMFCRKPMYAHSDFTASRFTSASLPLRQLHVLLDLLLPFFDLSLPLFIVDVLSVLAAVASNSLGKAVDNSLRQALSSLLHSSLNFTTFFRSESSDEANLYSGCQELPSAGNKFVAATKPYKPLIWLPHDSVSLEVLRQTLPEHAWGGTTAPGRPSW